MATNTAANDSLWGDIEQGRIRAQHNATYKTSYVRDITYKVIPFCSVFLVVFSVGAVLVSTLAYGKPVPQQGAIVISSILGVLLLLFCIGGIYLYHEKHYPSLTKGPNCPDRPEPRSTKLHWNPHRTWKAMSGNFQRGTKFMMMAITKKRQSSVTGTTSTASRLRRHEQEVPDRLQGRAVSPDTFYARALHNNERPVDSARNDNGQGGWLPPTRPPHSPQGHHGFVRADRDVEPNPTIQYRNLGGAYTQREVYFPPIRTPASRIPHNHYPPAPGPTRKPLPNRHAVHLHSPKTSSHLRNVDTATQDDDNSGSARRHIVVGLDPTLLRQPHNVQQRRQYLDIPPSTSRNTKLSHPGAAAHNAPPMSSPAPGPIGRNRHTHAARTPQRNTGGQPTSQYAPRTRPDASRPPSRTFEEIFGQGESNQGPRSPTENPAYRDPPLFAGVVKVPETSGHLVFAEPGLYFKLSDPGDVRPRERKALTSDSRAQGNTSKARSDARGGDSSCRGPKQPAPAYLGKLQDCTQACDRPSAPGRVQGPSSTAATPNPPDPFVDAGGLVGAIPRRLGRGAVSDRRGDHGRDRGVTRGNDYPPGTYQDPVGAATPAIPPVPRPSSGHESSPRDEREAREYIAARAEEKHKTGAARAYRLRDRDRRRDLPAAAAPSESGRRPHPATFRRGHREQEDLTPGRPVAEQQAASSRGR